MGAISAPDQNKLVRGVTRGLRSRIGIAKVCAIASDVAATAGLRGTLLIALLANVPIVNGTKELATINDTSTAQAPHLRTISGNSRRTCHDGFD
ncbi:hypothetical protein OSCI_3490057 [Kamptonema sp. PCC 6506]|nr:hypothetical protein OSCI_3490057 [Kamptonema sp. PCC 6506]